MKKNINQTKLLKPKFLLDDDIICAHDNKEQNHIVKCTVKELREICENRMLIKSAPNKITSNYFPYRE